MVRIAAGPIRVVRNACAAVALAGLLHAPVAAQATAAKCDPFIRVGEELTYAVHSARFGDMGTATMRTERDTVDGRAAFRFTFDFNARVLLFHVSNHMSSWIDAETLTTLRYRKNERSPIGSHDEDVRIRPAQHEWTDGKDVHETAADAPLDELSFIYLIRSIADELDATALSVDRHFDAKRNVISMRNTGRTQVFALNDTLAATRIEMQARDDHQKSGSSKLIFYIGDDAAHLPLRMDTSMPMAGTLTMTLVSVRLTDAIIADN